METVLIIAAAGIVAFVPNILVRRALESVRVDPGARVPNLQGLWDALSTVERETATGTLGAFERILFFGAFLLPGAAVAAAGWLAFEIAAKWQAWQQIVKVPESRLRESTEEESLRFRHAWGSRTLARFLIGTLANVIIGMAAAVLTLMLLGRKVIGG